MRTVGTKPLLTHGTQIYRDKANKSYATEITEGDFTDPDTLTRDSLGARELELI